MTKGKKKARGQKEMKRQRNEVSDVHYVILRDVIALF